MCRTAIMTVLYYDIMGEGTRKDACGETLLELMCLSTIKQVVRMDFSMTGESAINKNFFDVRSCQSKT